MRRILVILVVALAALIVLPPLWFSVVPGEAPPEMPPGDRRIPVGDGVSVSAVVRGGGKTVVLVHGLPGSGHDWQPLTRLLSRRGHQVIAYDRVGYGNSDGRKGDDYTTDASARDLLGLLESQDVTDATVVGWSYGGAAAIRAARIDPSRIGRLVLVGSAGYRPEVPEDPVVFKILFSPPVMRWIGAVPPVGRAVQTGFSRQAFGDEAMPDWWLPTLAANFASPHTPLTHGKEGEQMTWGEELDTAPIDRPILVIHGEDDQLVPVEVARMLDERSARSQLFLIEGGSHMLPITRTDEIAKRVASFVFVD